MTQKRQSQIQRHTAETQVTVDFCIDGKPTVAVDTGIGFFDHMLTLFATHGLFNLTVSVKGDLHIDYHHSVEDVGICLGEACRNAIGDARGIVRYASIQLPMDEALCQCAIDVSNRPYLGYSGHFSPGDRAGNFDAELVEEFFVAFTNNARINLHLSLLAGRNIHHKIEACFKAFGVCLDRATQRDPRKATVPSTKGVL